MFLQICSKNQLLRIFCLRSQSNFVKMNDSKIKSLLLYFMDYYQRRRVLLQRQLITKHNALIDSMAIQRRNTTRRIFAVNNDLAAKFIKENTHFVRFRERKKQRSEKIWQLLQATGNEALFFQHFRMSKQTFQKLCDKLNPQLKTNQPVLITIPLTVEKQLAICLYKLASGGTYKEIGETFGVSKCTVYKYFRATIEAIVKLKNEFIRFPETVEASSGFEQLTKLPNLCGVIDNTHIPILPPEHENASFINSEGWSSVALQAVIDHKLLFCDVCITSGGVVDIFKETDLSQKISKILPTTSITTAKYGNFPLMLIGDLSYPLHPHLLKPYTDNSNSQTRCFNTHIENGLAISQLAFKHLKGRWKCLQKKMEINPDFVPSVILACCILHNFLVLEKENLLDTWQQVVLETEHEFPQPKKTENIETYSNLSIDPFVLRESLKEYLNKKF